MSRYNKGNSNCKSCQSSDNTINNDNSDDDYNYSTFSNRTRFQYDQQRCGPCRPCYSLKCEQPVVESCNCVACKFSYNQILNGYNNSNCGCDNISSCRCNKNKNYKKCRC